MVATRYQKDLIGSVANSSTSVQVALFACAYLPVLMLTTRYSNVYGATCSYILMLAGCHDALA